MEVQSEELALLVELELELEEGAETEMEAEAEMSIWRREWPWGLVGVGWLRALGRAAASSRRGVLKYIFLVLLRECVCGERECVASSECVFVTTKV